MGDEAASTATTGVTNMVTSMFQNTAITSYVKVTIAIGIFGSLWSLAQEKVNALISRIGYNFIISVAVDSKDESYQWMLEWLAMHPYSLSATNLGMITAYDSENGSGVTPNIRPKVVISPYLGNHFLSYKGHYYWITRTRDTNANDLTSGGFYENLTITLFGRNRRAIQGLITDAMDAAFQRDENKLVIYINSSGSWSRFGPPRPVRPLESVILDKEVKEGIVDDVKEFLSARAWYRDMGIPFRRGYLLHGHPGTGKSSFIKALAGELKMSLCLVSLNDKDMTDDTLNDLLNSAPPRSILLLEDIDAALGNRDDEHGSRLTFSGLLNALDGIGSQEGKIVFMTTNKINRLDAALIRPGRIDVRYFFGLATSHQIASLFRRFYPEISDEAVEDFTSKVPERRVSMADLQGFLLENKKHPIRSLEGVSGWLDTVPPPLNLLPTLDIHRCTVACTLRGHRGSVCLVVNKPKIYRKHAIYPAKEPTERTDHSIAAAAANTTTPPLSSPVETMTSKKTEKITTVEDDTVGYTFRWPYGGNDLAVGGQWADWQKQSMSRDGNEFVLRIDGLKPRNRYLYKYVVDGTWKEDLTAPIDDQEMVNGQNVINNILVTGSSSREERITELEKERDALFRQVRQFEQKSGDRSAVDASARLQKLQREYEESERARKEHQAKSSSLEAELAKLKSAKPVAPAADPKDKEELSKSNAKVKDLESQLLALNTQLEASQKYMKAAESKRTATDDAIDYTFTWPYGGKDIAIGGTFNNWQVQKMTRSGDDFNATVSGLKPNTKYLYKYNVDGVWKEDLTAPTDDSERVNQRPVINNVLNTGSSDKAARLVAAEKERDQLFRQVKNNEIASVKTKNDLESKLREILDSHGKCSVLQSDNDKKLKDLAAQLESTKKENDSLKSSASKTSAAAASGDKIVKDLQAQLDAANKANKELEAKITAMEKTSLKAAGDEKAAHDAMKKSLGEEKAAHEATKKSAAEAAAQLAAEKKAHNVTRNDALKDVMTAKTAHGEDNVKSGKELQAEKAAHDVTKKSLGEEKAAHEATKKSTGESGAQLAAEKKAHADDNAKNSKDLQAEKTAHDATKKSAADLTAQLAAEKKSHADDNVKAAQSLETEKKSHDETKKLLAAEKSAHDSTKKNQTEAAQRSADEAQKISYTFRWPYEGKTVGVGGQFNDWKVQPMTAEKKGDTERIARVDGLKPNTKYLYKYNVDGQWKEDLTAPTDDSEKVNGRAVVNNVLAIGSADKTQRLEAAERERDQLFREVNNVRDQSGKELQAEKAAHDVTKKSLGEEKAAHEAAKKSAAEAAAQLAAEKKGHDATKGKAADELLAEKKAHADDNNKNGKELQAEKTAHDATKKSLGEEKAAHEASRKTVAEAAIQLTAEKKAHAEDNAKAAKELEGEKKAHADDNNKNGKELQAEKTAHDATKKSLGEEKAAHEAAKKSAAEAAAQLTAEKKAHVDDNAKAAKELEGEKKAHADDNAKNSKDLQAEKTAHDATKKSAADLTAQLAAEKKSHADDNAKAAQSLDTEKKSHSADNEKSAKDIDAEKKAHEATKKLITDQLAAEKKSRSDDNAKLSKDLEGEKKARSEEKAKAEKELEGEKKAHDDTKKAHEKEKGEHDATKKALGETKAKHENVMKNLKGIVGCNGC
ncbi:mitochondrial chaperone BCS1 [Planoprotostelium fungivorum]|uniref:Mitochondrial chaperone BCS1 n=1 Tax=Planoprotostelium fungivorum TaxID=1890364 RepID=A0A2P6NDD8_9EUKA|nr:mitochondrial chaperone BCS1 [Planoprotostelium fungivorum]